MRKVLLCILDGVGSTNKIKGNAFFNAKTPTFDNLVSMYPHKDIEASGIYVGLPEGQIGNSEVGHLTIGAGRVYYQPLSRINNAIKDKTFYSNIELLKAIDHAKRNNSKLHIMGLLSDGGVHSHINHFLEILKVCKDNDFKNVYFHIFTDGRDTYYKSSKKYLDILQNRIEEYGFGSISSVCGRYYGMDRDNRWDRIKKAYDSIVFNKADMYNSYDSLIDDNYKKEIYDEFIIPGIIDSKGNVEENDSIIWNNFRTDRSLEMLLALTDKCFDHFEVKKFNNLFVTTLMWVSDKIKSNIMFKPISIENPLGVYLSKKGLKQLRIAETEKYAHVTYFFDGLKNIDLDNCKKILIPSPKVNTYDLTPEMSSKEITNNLLKEMNNNYDFILMNFANGDMLGHTGNYNQTINSLETLDELMSKIYNECLKKDYLLIITADHGNCEEMIDENENIVTRHTNNKVPFIVCDKNVKLNINSLSEVAPFILKLMNLEIPKEMK